MYSIKVAKISSVQAASEFFFEEIMIIAQMKQTGSAKAIAVFFIDETGGFFT